MEKKENKKLTMKQLELKSQLLMNLCNKSKEPKIPLNIQQLNSLVTQRYGKYQNRIPKGPRNNIGHSPESYQMILNKMFKKIEENKKKTIEKIEVHNSSFLAGITSQEILIKNTSNKQEKQIFDRLKESQFTLATKDKINNITMFSKIFNNNIDSFQAQFKSKQNISQDKHTAVKTFHLTFCNPVVLEGKYIEEDLFENINQIIYEYAVFKNKLTQDNQIQNNSFQNQSINTSRFSVQEILFSLLQKQNELIKSFVDLNKNDFIVNCLKVIQEQFWSVRNLYKSNSYEQNQSIQQKNEINKILIETSCKILEQNFLKKIKNRNIIPMQINASQQMKIVYSYLNQDYLIQENDIRANLEFINDTPLWALIYFALRAGIDTTEICNYLSMISNHEYPDVDYINSLIKHSGKIPQEYQNLNSLQNSIFKDLLLFIYGQKDKYDEFPFEEIWDYLWIELKQCQYSKHVSQNLQQLQQELDREESKQTELTPNRLLVFSLAQYYESMLYEMFRNIDLKFQALALYYFLVEVKFINEDNLLHDTKFKLKNSYIRLVKEISQTDSLLALSYLTCYQNVNIFTNQMCFMFKNNNKLLKEYYNYDTHSNKKLLQLKRIFKKKYLKYFYDQLLKEQLVENELYQPIWIYIMAYEAHNYAILFEIVSNAYAIQISQIVDKKLDIKVSESFQSNLDYIQYIEHNLLKQVDNQNYPSVNEYILNHYIKNLIVKYNKKKIDTKTVLNHIKQLVKNDINQSYNFQSSIVIHIQFIKFVLQLIQIRFLEGKDQMIQKTVKKELYDIFEKIETLANNIIQRYGNSNQVNCLGQLFEDQNEKIAIEISNVRSMFRRN